MRTITSKFLPFVFVPVICFLAPSAYGKSADDQVDEYTFEVLYLINERPIGRLIVSSNSFAYEPDQEGIQSRTWNADSLRRVELKHSRLLVLRDRAGESHRFAPVGDYRFDDSFARFLRETVGSNVDVKAKL